MKQIPCRLNRCGTTNGQIITNRPSLKRMCIAHPHPADGFAGMEIHDRAYAEKDAAGEALMDAVARVAQTEPVEIGSYRGFTITATLTVFGEHKLTFKDTVAYTIDLGDSATGNLIRLDNALARLPEHLEEYRAKLADLKQQLESAKAEAAKPFEMEARLQQASARLAELDAALNLGSKGGAETAA